MTDKITKIDSETLTIEKTIIETTTHKKAELEAIRAGYVKSIEEIDAMLDVLK